jgi:PAS domain S-box-containing protein
MLLVDPENGQLIDANPAAAEYYGWSQTELKKMNISNINTLTTEEIRQEMINAVEEKRHHFIFRHRKANGIVSNVEVYSGPIITNGRKVLYSIVHDITERTNAENNLHESEQRFRNVVEGAPDAIYIQSKGLFVYLNQSALQLFGATSAKQLIGTSIFERYHPDSRELAKNRMLQAETLNIPLPTVEKTYLKMDGTPVAVESTPVPIIFNKISSIMIFTRDISNRKQMERDKLSAEAQLRQQQKLEAVGTLAGGVAHEINNPINGIMNYAQLILDETDPISTNAQYLTGIIHESKRISDIVKSLLQFSSQNSHSHSYARIDDIIHHTVSLIRTIIKKDQINLMLDIEENLPDIKCRSQQIQQVLMNLLTNARDALNDKYPDRHADKMIVLSCHQYEREDRKWFKIVVKDYGNGIPDDIRQKMYEPFFSTKPKEIGTGLGLSISFGIVKDHHGYFEVETDLGQYTNFIVHLPVDNGWVREDLQKSEVVS